MINFESVPVFELIHIIVNYGMGSRILHKAKTYGIGGGTIFSGRGTINNALLNFLSLCDERKEIVLMGTDKKTADHALKEMNAVFHFEKANHGIVFTTSACAIIGSQSCVSQEEGRGEDKAMYQSIITIVDRGKAEDVIEAAKSAGSKGGTIINARGSGAHETSKLFNMNIEPEKEMVIILSKQAITEDIVLAIRQKLEIDKPGNGIIFIQNVNTVYGVYE